MGWHSFEIGLQVVVFVGVGLYMWSVSSSLEQIAKDVGRLAGRSGAKPADEDA